MSVGFWWFQAVVGDEHLRALAPSFQEALKSLRDDLPILQTWNRTPDEIVSGSRRSNQMVYEFSDAFLTEELQAFGEGAFDLPDDSSLELIDGDKITPASIFWFAVGPAGATRLPGRRGAMLIESGAVPAARATIDAVLGEVGREHLVAQAQRYYNHGTSHDGFPDAKISTVLQSLPSLLETAHRTSAGVITFSMAEM